MTSKTRNDLKPLRNRRVSVTAIVDEVRYRTPLDIDDNGKLNVCILLKPVSVDGIELDHIWIYQRNKFYDMFKSLKGEHIKFKANVVSYVKNRNGIYQEDYGIEPTSKIMTKESYDKKIEDTIKK
ncbi:TPA: hypothetical protein R8C65_002692 [Staphylococcus aureus]|uniref:hypothetical protein n=1 Tax=Staphylococcus TaxID=1279 RepID=UPI000B7C5FB6|nr:hypothetical protein [Staphylococcus aureus]HDA2604492.1 hypothetical protein [Staphylococcus aureus]HDE0230060.1 hypothetical protein [Staphylococcus aureus]HEE8759886.1 hypothetical protein [Staphylococcus aureus]